MRFFVGQIVDIVLAVFLVIFGKYLGRLVFFSLQWVGMINDCVYKV